MHLGGCVEAERASERKLAWSDGGREKEDSLHNSRGSIFGSSDS